MSKYTNFEDAFNAGDKIGEQIMRVSILERQLNQKMPNYYNMLGTVNEWEEKQSFVKAQLNLAKLALNQILEEAKI